jgi:diguanylate cyclase (GGDEF)-like protein
VSLSGEDRLPVAEARLKHPRAGLRRFAHALRGIAPIDRLILIAVSCGIAATAGALWQWQHRGWHFEVVAIVSNLIIAIGCEMIETQISLGGRRHGMAWGDASLVFGLAFLPTPAVVLIKCVAVLVEHVVRRRDWRRTAFNTATTAITVYPVAWACHAITAAAGISPEAPISWPVLAAAAVAWIVAANLAVAAAVSATGGGRWAEVVRSSTLDLLRSAPFTIAASLLCLAGWHYNKASLVALPFVFIVMWQANSRSLRRGTERDALRRLAAASASMPALSLVEMTDEVRRRAADLFGARGVQLRISSKPAGATAEHIEPRSGPGGVEVALIGRNGHLGYLGLDVANSGGLTQQEKDVLVTFANTTASALETVLAHAEQLHIAQHDTLTGLPNRALLADNAERMLAAARAGGTHCALVLLDLNGFKNVNDTLGHAAGDQLLLEIGTRLADSVRSSDCVARLGGDEFVVLLDKLDGEIDSGRLAASLVERVSIPVTIDGLRLAVEACAGVAIFPNDGTTVDNLLRCADVAMYEAKRRGDSVVHYDPSQDLASPERLGLLADLQSALDADDQLHLHFQPQLDMRTGLTGNVEALVRWRHPTRGNLSPAEFVPVIEHSALIGPFTAKVLDEAVRCCVDWQTDASLHGVGVAVNLSARNLMHRDLPDEVARILARHGLPARKLVLEITETAAMNDTEICESVLGRLRDLGIRLSVDDFGTGYASLTFLRRIDVAEVKLDRAFVADMLEDEAAATIVGATVALAHGLGLTVVAEGVETEEQLAALHLAGCDLAQGYFLSKPVPPDLLSDGAESAVAKAAAAGVIERTSRQPLPPRLPVPARRTPLARDLTR